MLCPITDHGPVQIEYDEFIHLCMKNQQEQLCTGCRAGTLVRVGETVTEFPKDITIKDVTKVIEKVIEKVKKENGNNNPPKKEIKVPEQPPKEKDFEGNEWIQPIRASVVKRLDLPTLKPYLKKKLYATGQRGPCANCDRELRITAFGMCGMCYNASRNLKGEEVLVELDTCRARAKTMKNSPDVPKPAGPINEGERIETKTSEAIDVKKILIRIKGDSKFEKGSLEITMEDGIVKMTNNGNFEVFSLL